MTTAAQSSTAPEGSIKETLISMIISLAMALVAKSYVIEAFVIPTGSMAPTLLGQNIRFQSPESGYNWAVNPWQLTSRDQASKVQWLGEELGPQVTDPMSTSRFNIWSPRQRPDSRIYGYTLPLEPKRPGAGDRILVQKYLYEISPPKRFDVVVFKNPENASENFIKRLVGLPNEQIWIVDGDIFARPMKDGQPAGEWAIARKPSRIQKSLWRTLYSSEYAPLDNIRTSGNANHFTSPWNGAGWNTGKERTYTCATADLTTLAWNTDNWPIWDWVPYNDSRLMDCYRQAKYQVSDVRVRAGVRAEQNGLSASTIISAHGHEFRALLENQQAKLQVRATTAEGAIASEWKTLDDQSFGGFTPGRVVNVEFWRVDQSLQLWLDGNRVCNAEYNWSPEERLANVLGVPFSDVPRKGQPEWSNWLADPSNYHAARCGVRWEFKGSPLSLERVGLDRDVFYEPASLGSTTPALGTHPDNLPSLNSDQFFVCGDNSPSSKDARLWTTVDPWIADQIDPTVGVVNRKLMMGKAFYVYFPAMHTALGSIPVPDFGRMRFIK